MSDELLWDKEHENGYYFETKGRKAIKIELGVRFGVRNNCKTFK